MSESNILLNVENTKLSYYLQTNVVSSFKIESFVYSAWGPALGMTRNTFVTESIVVPMIAMPRFRKVYMFLFAKLIRPNQPT